ncbi:hypothetical protein WJX73_008843 [Symbiochloris irregularis]|uniref:Uncharacterized protein n=1 Tax=Symbiochloris irregularis TaxID=706552 RepID=A0AAW1NPK9_9CHLO
MLFQSPTWRCILPVKKGTAAPDDREPKINPACTVIVLSMGTHLLSGDPGPQQLMQIAIPGLEDRTRALPPLKTPPEAMLSPGYFDAPGAKQCPLPCGLKTAKASLPHMVICFCAINCFKNMKEADWEATQRTLIIYQKTIRRCLKFFGGYECQEINEKATFMLAFDYPDAAARFCLQVQQEMLGEEYSDEELRLPNCGIVMSEQMQPLWQGPRISMGLYEDKPEFVMPHATSGRADYDGSIKSRAARFSGAAQGGQILMSLATAEGLRKEWSGQRVDLSTQLEDPERAARQHQAGAFASNSTGGDEALSPVRRDARTPERWPSWQGKPSLRKSDSEMSSMSVGTVRNGNGQGGMGQMRRTQSNLNWTPVQNVQFHHVGSRNFKGMPQAQQVSCPALMDIVDLAAVAGRGLLVTQNSELFMRL